MTLIWFSELLVNDLLNFSIYLICSYCDISLKCLFMHSNTFSSFTFSCIQKTSDYLFLFYFISFISQCRMVSQSLSVDVLVRILTIFPYLSKKISEPLHNLFLSQMADKMFKKNLAIAYAEGYALFTQAYGRGYGTTECSIFSLSVQF